MIIKGIISSKDITKRTAEIILPEYNNVVTRGLKFYHDEDFDNCDIGGFVLVAVLNNDFNDLIII